MAQKTVAEELAEIRRMDVPALVFRYEEVFGKRPRSKHRAWLQKRIAYRIQERRFGGLSSQAQDKLEKLIAELDLPQLEGRRGPQAIGRVRGPVVGTILTRTWRGQEIRATAVDGGWEHEGVVYRSLSRVAKAVTGSHMSGPAFFGLTKREGA